MLSVPQGGLCGGVHRIARQWDALPACWSAAAGGMLPPVNTMCTICCWGEGGLWQAVTTVKDGQSDFLEPPCKQHCDWTGSTVWLFVRVICLPPSPSLSRT